MYTYKASIEKKKERRNVAWGLWLNLHARITSCYNLSQILDVWSITLPPPLTLKHFDSGFSAPYSLAFHFI